MNQASTSAITPPALASLLARIRAKRELESRTTTSQPAPTSSQPTPVALALSHAYGKHGEAITYNAEQQSAINLASSGADLVLIGAAGTGKTTTMMGVITALTQAGHTSILRDTKGHKHLVEGTPGIVACSFTRRAVSNLRKAMPPGLESNCITIHKLLEYQPFYYEVTDPETGESKSTMRFEPARTAFNPLPSELTTIIIDESSMVSVELFNLLLAALPHKVQWIFLGDIQQLPPVFGSAILGYKMLEVNCVELTQVYRQALDSPIIKYATQIKDGHEFALPDKLTEETSRGKITFHPWKKKLSGDVAMLTFCKFATSALDSGGYNPATDCILVPFNKAFGTDEINKHIANHLAKTQGRTVWEIVAGFNKLYLSVGDKVLYDKEDATVTKIVRNAQYLGKRPQHEATTLDYWGYNSAAAAPAETSADSSEYSEADIDFMLDALSSHTSVDERVRAASHLVTVTMDDSGEEVEIDSASDLNSLLLSYALTVHKAQGSEWDKVFLVLHQSHATMCQRELLYTAVTRAAKELYVICEPETFQKGVASQRIKGDTLAEKAEFFKGKLEANGGVY